MSGSVPGGEVQQILLSVIVSELCSDMYVLIVYDVEVLRVTKVHTFLKRYLHWVQNSVFEGELTGAQIEKVKSGLRRIMDEKIDSVLVYTSRERRWLTRESIGHERGETGNLL
jgi:CRISPR-associated protein Cas2